MFVLAKARRVVATGLGSAVLATGLVGVTAVEAQAAAPICSKTVTKSWTDNYGYKFSGPVAAASNGSLNCQMGPGNSSSAVKALQYAFNRCTSYAQLAVDGIYGSGTKAGIAKLQRAYGLNDDGLYGPSTRKIFDWIITGTQGAACRSF
jgi:peptidoglycan hydrolase-like protein with peptidoglycan-binding domain